MKIEQGVRQDHLGRYYQVQTYDDGRQEQVFISPPELSARAKKALEVVTVESKGQLGTTFQSLACYQSAGA